MGNDYLNPRQRTFVVQNYMSQTFITLDDIFAGDVLNTTQADNQTRIYALQADRIVKRLNDYIKSPIPALNYFLRRPAV